MLDRAVATFPPSTSWWIKGDAVDLVEGLCESVRGEWSGDIDLSDGQLQQMFQQYKDRLQFINKIGLDERRDHSLILTDVQQVQQSLESDLEFLAKSMYM